MISMDPLPPSQRHARLTTTVVQSGFMRQPASLGGMSALTPARGPALPQSSHGPSALTAGPQPPVPSHGAARPLITARQQQPMTEATGTPSPEALPSSNAVELRASERFVHAGQQASTGLIGRPAGAAGLVQQAVTGGIGLQEAGSGGTGHAGSASASGSHPSALEWGDQDSEEERTRARRRHRRQIARVVVDHWKWFARDTLNVRQHGGLGQAKRGDAGGRGQG